MIFYIIMGAAVVLFLYTISVYNRLVKNKNMAEEAWSGIDVQLKKRYDLIPSLVNTVKGYASHEKETLENVIKWRNMGVSANTVKDQENAEVGLSAVLGRLIALSENYPDLKANANFQDLQKQLSEIENAIQLSRRYYNGVVRDLNIAIESFPSNLVASSFAFSKKDFFEMDSAQREAPEVKF
ncbi:MAG: LemA family protein [Imperialibacter sp.]|uniref:LemA family protein n=1 Tax=Imperialibacter sp. TaxID=2038411 RepID=UPI0032ED39D7